MLDIKPLSAGFGASIGGLELTRPLSAGTVTQIAGALYDHSVVYIPGQDLSPVQLEAFGAYFGTPLQHVEKDLLLEDAQGVMSLSNADGRPERQRNGGAFWHTDLVFTEEPASVTMLQAVAVPESGGETRFANQYNALDALPKNKQDELSGLTVRHCYEGRTDGSMPTVRHPLVRSHPVTGRPALYGATGTCIGIDGMADDAAADLLDEIGRHATADEFVYAHDYTVGDVVLWDNAATLHCGPTLEEARGAGDARIMHRVSVRGWPPK